MKYVYVYHSAEVIDTFVFNQSHCVPVVRPLMDHNNKHSAYHQVHCRTRTIISYYFQETWHCPENRRLCQWLEKTKSKRLRTFSYEVMQDINNGVQWFNLLPRKSRIWMMGVFFPHLGVWKRRRYPYLLSWWDDDEIRKYQKNDLNNDSRFHLFAASLSFIFIKLIITIGPRAFLASSL